MAQTAKASHLFSISGWSKFALLIIWVVGDLVLSYFALLIKELTETSGLNIRFRESSHIPGGRRVAILACDSFRRPRAFSEWVYGTLFHTAKLGSWYRIDIVHGWGRMPVHGSVGSLGSCLQVIFLARSFWPCPSSLPTTSTRFYPQLGSHTPNTTQVLACG